MRVNWTERDTVAFELQEGDILSIRGSGRVKIIMTEGRTKKIKSVFKSVDWPKKLKVK